MSPQIHASALHALGLNGEYTLYPVRPLPEGAVELKALLTRMRNDEIHGLNVTIPHKQQIIPLLDGLTEAATRIGAVNTIFKIDGRLLGDNTDASGFWADVQRITYNDVRTAVVLGAGGSARAVTYALLTQGYRLVIAARSVERAVELCSQFSGISDRLMVCELQHLAAFTGGCSLVVNTTPVGMHPQVDVSPWPAGTPFPENAAVYDLVYNPRETLLVRQAKGAGLPAISGQGMLIEQAALAFERWTGLLAPRVEMAEAVSGF